MFLNRTREQCPAGKTPNTEADWDAFSAMADFAPGTNMEQEKVIFLNQCKFENNPKDTVFEMCPPGTMMVDGVCVAVDISREEMERRLVSTNISPALILAAAAAYFFAG